MAMPGTRSAGRRIPRKTEYKSAWSGEQVDSFLRVIDGLRKSVNTRSSVRKRRAVLQLMEALSEVRNFIRGLLEGETGGSGRPVLTKIFGGDCYRIAHLQAVMDSLAEVLESSGFSEDARLEEFNKAIAGVSDILREAGLGARLKEALENAKEGVERDVDEWRRQLIEKVDKCDGDDEVCKAVEELFSEYDADGNGMIAGEEYDDLVADLCDHVRAESKARSIRLKMPTLQSSDEHIKALVLSFIDPASERKISSEQALIGIKKIVDDIEDGPQQARKNQLWFQAHAA